MNSKKVTVTIGIPVHNENATITHLLHSIMKQSSENFVLEHVFVVCDGTSDGTDKTVTLFAKDAKVVRLLNDKKRLGKMKRLEQLYQKNQSDLLCVFDGDVVLGNAHVLEKLVSKFTQSDVAIVGANNQPVSVDTFVGKLINTWSHVWYLARLNYNNGDNVHNIRGCGMALRGSFAKTIHFPPEIVSDAQFLYFFCLNAKMKFRFEKDAVIFYRKPSSLYDHLLQQKRSIPEKDKLEELYGDYVTKMYKIPKRIKYLAFIKQLLRNPIITILSVCFYMACAAFPYMNFRTKQEVIWKRASSTKKPIPLSF